MQTSCHPSSFRRRHSAREIILLVGVAGAFLFFAVRLISAIQQWKFLLYLYPFYVPAYLLASGLAFGLTLPVLGYGLWRRQPWARRAAWPVFLCWSFCMAAERIYSFSIGWQNGWEMDLAGWVVTACLFFWVNPYKRKNRRIPAEKQEKKG